MARINNIQLPSQTITFKNLITHSKGTTMNLSMQRRQQSNHWSQSSLESCECSIGTMEITKSLINRCIHFSGMIWCEFECKCIFTCVSLAHKFSLKNTMNQMIADDNIRVITQLEISVYSPHILYIIFTYCISIFRISDSNNFITHSDDNYLAFFC